MAVPEVNLRQGEGQILASGKLAFQVTVLGIPNGMGNAHTEPFEVFLRSRVLMVFVIINRGERCEVRGMSLGLRVTFSF